ncbi:phage tail protein I [Xylella fastidiosa]|uniref:phage tail protein I n=1 Tax=Xylella fastidiosa TaxID=2371 RepID=UPI0035D496C0
MVRSFGGDVLITEWWQQNLPAAPHTFTLLLTFYPGQGGSQSTAEFVADVITEVIRTKPSSQPFHLYPGRSHHRTDWPVRWRTDHRVPTRTTHPGRMRMR